MIKDIIESIRQQQALASKAIIQDPRTLATQIGNIKRAEENLNHLFIDLRDQVRQNMVLILASGKHSKEFAEIAQENYACISFDAAGIFKDFASKVDETFLGKPASPTILDIAMSQMSDLAYEIGLMGYNNVGFKTEDSIQLKTRKDVEKMIMTAFNREVGAELVVLKAIHDASKKIMDSDFEGKKVPIVLYSNDNDLISKIATDALHLTSRVFAVNNNKKPTIEAVESKLVELSKQSA